jgi:hypothetical protein
VSTAFLQERDLPRLTFAACIKHTLQRWEERELDGSDWEFVDELPAVAEFYGVEDGPGIQRRLQELLRSTPRGKVTTERILDLRDQGWSNQMIATRWGVDQSTVWRKIRNVKPRQLEMEFA